MDLIDRDELEKELQNSCNDYSDTIHIVWDMPTVDAVPLSIIDEIKAEIEKLANDEWNSQVGSVSQGLEDALEIIDEKVKEYAK